MHGRRLRCHQRLSPSRLRSFRGDGGPESVGTVEFLFDLGPTSQISDGEDFLRNLSPSGRLRLPT